MYPKHVDNLCHPSNSKEISTICTINIPKPVLKVVEILRFKEGISRSEFIRRAVRYYLSHETDYMEWCIEKGKEYDIRMKGRLLEDPVDIYMKEKGYGNIRRLEY